MTELFLDSTQREGVIPSFKYDCSVFELDSGKISNDKTKFLVFAFILVPKKTLKKSYISLIICLVLLLWRL